SRKLEEAISGVTLGNLRPLSNVYASFYDEVNRRGFCTRALKYAVVADFLSEDHLSSFDAIVVAGFFALTNVEKTIFQTLKRMDTVVFLFQQGKGLEKHLQEVGLRPKHVPVGRVASPANNEVLFYQSPDSHGQVFALSGKIQEQRKNSGALDERTVVVLPASETLLPIYHQTLALLKDDEFNISLGYPVIRTPVYGFLQSLMDLVGSMYDDKLHAPDYVKFVLHPYTKNILFSGRSDVTRILFHSLEEHFAGEKSRTFFTLEEIEGEVQLLTDVAQRVIALGVDCSSAHMRQHLRTIHDRTIRKLIGAPTLGSLAQRCIEVLMYVDEESTAQQHPLFRPYVETLIESLDGIAC
ncbi:MAG: hypothetical protein AAB393_04510, partial [Bacteroidota bacterium]